MNRAARRSCFPSRPHTRFPGCRPSQLGCLFLSKCRWHLLPQHGCRREAESSGPQPRTPPHTAEAAAWAWLLSALTPWELEILRLCLVSALRASGLPGRITTCIRGAQRLPPSSHGLSLIHGSTEPPHRPEGGGGIRVLHWACRPWRPFRSLG